MPKTLTRKDVLGKMTLAQYEAYDAQEPWQFDILDGKPFKDQEQWEKYWVGFIETKLQQSREKSRRNKREWWRAIQEYELFDDKQMKSPTEQNPCDSKIPWVRIGVRNRVALLLDNAPVPQFEPRQDSQEQFVAGLNYCSEWELDANDFQETLYDWVTDIQLCGLGILKTTIDPNETGPFGHVNRIEVETVEPRYFHPDPSAKSVSLKRMKWFIVAAPYDIGTIRLRYHESGGRVDSEPAYDSVGQMGLDKDGDYITGRVMQSPANDGRDVQTGFEGKAVVKEMWLKDYSKRFVADDELVDNLDENGDEVIKGKGRVYWRIKTDEDGFVIGSWQRRFPSWRCVVAANNVMLENFENPYWHDEPPYVFCRGVVSKQLMPPGDASHMLVLARKLNSLYMKVMYMADANTERPTIADQGSFDAPKRWSNLQGLADIVLQVRANAKFYKLEAGEIPLFVAPLLAKLEDLLGELIGIPGIMRGQLSEGAQLPVQSIQELQDVAAAPLRMQAKQIEQALKRFGNQMSWLVRESYPESPITFPFVNVTTGETKEEQWYKDGASDALPVAIQVGSALPGAKQGAFEHIFRLYREGVVDDEAVLDADRMPGRHKVLSRKTRKRLAEIKAQSEGRAVGLQIKEKQNPSGKPGRREGP